MSVGHADGEGDGSSVGLSSDPGFAIGDGADDAVLIHGGDLGVGGFKGGFAGPIFLVVGESGFGDELLASFGAG